MNTVLAIDIGTSAVKASCVCLETGELVGKIGRQSYDFDKVKTDYSEISLFNVWRALVSAVRQVTADNHDKN